MVIAAGLFFLVLLGLAFGIKNPQAPSYTTPNPSFSSNEERLEWRAQHALPRNEEDMQYMRQKLMEAAQKIKDSERPVGR
jgi:hypothetical protein